MLLGFLIFVVLLSGLVAYSADTIARRAGRKHLRLFGLRPKTTALIVAVASGMGISLASVLAFGLLNRTAINNITQADKLRTELGQLKKDVKATAADLKLAQQERDAANRRVSESKQETASALLDLGSAETKLKSTQAARSTLEGEVGSLQTRIQQLSALKSTLDAQAARNQQALKVSQRALEGSRKRELDQSARANLLGTQIVELDQSSVKAQQQARAAQDRAAALQSQIQALETQTAGLAQQTTALEASRAKVQVQLQAAQQSRDSALAERLKAEADLGSARKERDALQRDRQAALSARNTALSQRDAAGRLRDQANTARDAANAARDTANTVRAQATKSRDSALQARDVAQAQRESLAAERDALVKQRRDLMVQRDDAAQDLGNIRRELLNLQSMIGTLETQRQTLSAANSALSTANSTLKNTLSSAQANLSKLEVDYSRTNSELSASRNTDLIYSRNDLVYAGVVASVRNVPDFLRAAAAAAQKQGARGTPAARLSPDARAQLDTKLRGLNTNTFVQCRAAVNVAGGFPVDLSCDARPQTVLFRRGQIIRQTTIDLRRGTDSLSAQLTDLIRDTVFDLTARGVPPEYINDLGLSDSERLNVLDKLGAQSGAAAVVSLAARDDVRPGMPVDLYPVLR